MWGGMGRPKSFNQDEAVEIALNKFWELGYGACSVNTLSEAMGITRSSFYNAFGTREALFARAIDRYLEMVPTRALDLPSEYDVPTLLTETLREVCRTRGEASTAGKGCAVVNSIVELGGFQDPVGRKMAGLILGAVEQIEMLLDQAKADGDLHEDADTRAMALTLQTMIVGLNVMCKLKPGKDMLWSIAQTNLEALGLFREV